MSNSKLVCFTMISPNSTNPRKDAIRKITIHHMAGNLSVETCGNVFAPASRQASSNYAIGTDGRVGMYVEEANRAWTSSNADNDNQAVTIEVANDRIGDDWHVGDAALASLVELCADICRRNGIGRLNYTGDATGNLTRHNMFAATACPGPYLQSKYPYIAEEVNKRLAAESGRAEAGAEAGPEAGLTQITGEAKAGAAQMRTYLAGLNPEAPDLAAVYLEEGAAEGIRGDVAFAQSCLETGNFRFGGDVKPEQFNYAGIGATGGGNPGNSFESPRVGVRAQIQHLKAYVNREPLAGECVDPRFAYVERGVSPYIEWLGQKENPQGKGWATGKDYGSKILRILDAILDVDAPEEKTADESAKEAAEKTERKKAGRKTRKEAPAKSPEEVTVDNALAVALITEREHWLGLLDGSVKPDKADIQYLLDAAYEMLKKNEAEQRLLR